ncbi:protein-tyrosine phosphatase [Blastococcus aurantiacus]|uniref:Protein-tyrosine phosphatase n=1 Tax=Blastococcus aurantiacus TaxID=1550231 RepID=A0A1G7JQ00_9ACTN|nr:hypothetical protein [Blastococcus aurantiacus]SDF26874.1 protein-tyrosine phosphatase [Blastococcus aurantiacus]
MTEPRDDRAPDPSILVVCTANVCRSPAAEVLLRAALGPASRIAVGSAGLRARVGEPMAPEMARLLSVPAETVRARQFAAEAAREAGLVLTMTRAHRAAVVSAVPAALRRTFTLREFAALVELAEEAGAVPHTGPGERLTDLVRLAPRYRGLRTSGPDDDVDDPYGQAAPVYAHALAELRASVTVVAAALTP